jgi:hypothetical protein
MGTESGSVLINEKLDFFPSIVFQQKEDWGDERISHRRARGHNPAVPAPYEGCVRKSLKSSI